LKGFLTSFDSYNTRSELVSVSIVIDHYKVAIS